jgi:hypothetical protein
MGKTVLVMFPVVAGNQLLDALDQDGFDVQAALWLYRSEEDFWRLMIASPLVQRIGQIEAYKRILTQLQHIRPSLDPLINDIYMENITVVDPSDSLIRALKRVVRVAEGDPPVRLTRNALGDVFIDEAYIFRLR